MNYLAAIVIGLTLAGSAFASECDDKIKRLENIEKTDGQALAGGKVDDFRMLLEQYKGDWARVMKRPRELGLEQSAVNSHWLSRMDKAWLSWKVRQEIVRKLRGELARLGS